MPPCPPSSNRLPALDGLRALAVLLVFLIHSGGFGLRELGTVGNSLVDHGRYGVTMFFVLSAFSMCLSVKEGFEGQPVSWLRYGLRRFFRIAPLFYLLMIWLFVMGPGLGHYDPASVTAHFTFAMMVLPQYANDMIGVEWSIAVEMAFYLLFPLLVIWQHNRRFQVGAALLAVILISQGDRVAGLLGATFAENRGHNLLLHVYPFLLGYWAFRLVRSGWHNRLPALAWAGLALALPLYSILQGEDPLSGPLMALATVCLLFVIQSERGSKLLGHPVLSHIGKVSYSIYLLHTLMIGHFRYHEWGTATGMFTALMATIGLATLTFHFIEVPGQKLGRWLGQKLTTGKAAPPPQTP